VDRDPWSCVDSEPSRGQYELGADARHEQLRLAAAFDEFAEAI